MSMQVLPTAPSPTVTHLMNLVTLISPRPGLLLPLRLRPSALASSHSHSQYEQGAQQQLVAPRSSKRAGRDRDRDKGQERNGCLALLVFSKKAKAPHRYRPAAALKNSPLAAGCCLVWLCALLAAATAGLGRRGVNARPQDTGQGGRRAGQDSTRRSLAGLPQVPFS